MTESTLGIPAWLVEHTVLDSDGCWLWVGAVGKEGYPVIRTESKITTLHHWMYEQVFGPLRPGIDVHHNCFKKRCINPGCLEALTKKQHAARHRDQRRRNHRKLKRWECASYYDWMMQKAG